MFAFMHNIAPSKLDSLSLGAQLNQYVLMATATQTKRGRPGLIFVLPPCSCPMSFTFKSKYWDSGPFILLFVIDFKIGCNFVDLGGPGGPGGPNLPSSPWGAKRPTSWKVNLN